MSYLIFNIDRTISPPVVPRERVTDFLSLSFRLRENSCRNHSEFGFFGVVLTGVVTLGSVCLGGGEL